MCVCVCVPGRSTITILRSSRVCVCVCVPGQSTITILRPVQQLPDKHNPNIVPLNLRNRNWHTFPRVEVHMHTCACTHTHTHTCAHFYKYCFSRSTVPDVRPVIRPACMSIKLCFLYTNMLQQIPGHET